MSWQYTVVGNGPLLMLALPHHVPVMISPADSDENRIVQAAFTPVWSIKGKLRAVVGERWVLQYNIVQVGWNYALTDKLSTSQLDEIAKQLIVDVKSVIPSALDPYTFGKEIGRMARLAQIADNLGIADARQQALQVMHEHLHLVMFTARVLSLPYLTFPFHLFFNLLLLLVLISLYGVSLPIDIDIDMHKTEL